MAIFDTHPFDGQFLDMFKNQDLDAITFREDCGGFGWCVSLETSQIFLPLSPGLQVP